MSDKKLLYVGEITKLMYDLHFSKEEVRETVQRLLRSYGGDNDEDSGLFSLTPPEWYFVEVSIRYPQMKGPGLYKLAYHNKSLLRQTHTIGCMGCNCSIDARCIEKWIRLHPSEELTGVCPECDEAALIPMLDTWPGTEQSFWEAVYDNFTIWSVDQRYPFIDYKHPEQSVARVKANDQAKTKSKFGNGK